MFCHGFGCFAVLGFFFATMSVGLAMTLFYVDVSFVVAVTPVGHCTFENNLFLYFCCKDAVSCRLHTTSANQSGLEFVEPYSEAWLWKY